MKSILKKIKKQFKANPKNFGLQSLLVILCLISIFLPHPAIKTKNPPPKGVPVRVDTIKQQDVPRTLDLVGTIIPYESVAIKTRLDSQITAVNFKDGQCVQEGMTLFLLDDRLLKAQLAQLEADLQRFTAEAERARRQMSRDAKLSKGGYSSQSAYDISENTYKAAIANQAGIRAQMENIKTQLSFTEIKAPISGRTSTVTITTGNTVKANDTAALVTINKVNPIKAKIPIPQRYYNDILHSLRTQGVSVIARDSVGKPLAKGHLIHRENTIDEQTRTLSVYASFDNPDDVLWPGMFVNVEVIYGLDKQAITIPIEAVKTSQNDMYVFVIQNNIAKKKTVKVIRNYYKIAIVTGDLHPGDAIVTDGFLLLKDGTLVTTRQEASSKEKNPL